MKEVNSSCNRGRDSKVMQASVFSYNPRCCASSFRTEQHLNISTSGSLVWNTSLVITKRSIQLRPHAASTPWEVDEIAEDQKALVGSLVASLSRVGTILAKGPGGQPCWCSYLGEHISWITSYREIDWPASDVSAFLFNPCLILLVRTANPNFHGGTGYKW